MQNLNFNGNRAWASNSNGFLLNRSQRPSTPSNLSVLSTVSGEISRTRALALASHGADTLNVEGNGGVETLTSNGRNCGFSKSTVEQRLQHQQQQQQEQRQHAFTSYNPHLIGVQSKFRRKYYRKVLWGVLASLIAALVIALIVVSLQRRAATQICHSKECLRTAASLAYTMDEGADPCEDFYQFTCGHWPHEHPRPDSVTSNDWFRERQSRVTRILREFLQQNVSDDEPQAVGKAKIMYKACMNTELLDKRDLEPLIRFVKKYELPLVPRGLNITLSAKSLAKFGNNSAKDFDWLHTMVLIKRSLGMDVIFGFDIFPDPVNRTINRIALGTPETDSALPFNKDDNHKLLHKVKRKTVFNHETEDNDMESDENEEQEEEEIAKRSPSGLNAYVTYVGRVVETYIAYLDPEIKIEDIEDSTAEMVLRAVQVARKIYKFKDAAENSTKPNKNPVDDILYISVEELQSRSDKLITPKTLPLWEKYLNEIMRDLNLPQNFSTDGLTIITSQADILYLQWMSEYILQVPPADLEFYIWLTVVEELILHTTSDMRMLHTEYMRAIIGTESSSARSLYCAHAVNSLMGMAVSYVLAEENFTRHKLPKVERMLSDIRRSFEMLVRSTSWMDETTKRETLQKSAEMKSFIGFPDWIRNASAMDEHYHGVKVNESTHLENMVGVLHWQMETKLTNFNESEPSNWATSPSNVNAFHTFQSNAITIPAAILQYPFYDLGLEALNYGSIGTILGHELTHGFDDSGRMFDKDGNMLQWWSNETINEYVNRTKCFIEQYSQYHLPDIDEFIDGELTLGENIADNGGMREAFHAYRLYVKDMGRERFRLPGLEHYTHEQLFFISFGNLWCESYTPAASRYALEDSHCPGKIRLKGVLTNSEEFADTFHCPKGSAMNPRQRKCRIW